MKRALKSRNALNDLPINVLKIQRILVSKLESFPVLKIILSENSSLHSLANKLDILCMFSARIFGVLFDSLRNSHL